MNDKCIIGRGYVGLSTEKAFSVDKFFTRHDSNITLKEAAKCRYIFICLPTPTVDGVCFTKDIEAVISEINAFPKSDRIFIIRSTVPPGFAKSLKLDNVVSNPEFLSEDTWEKDAVNPWMIVVGADNPKVREVVMGLYRGRFKYAKPLETDNTTAELIKYTLNAFFATKVVFANEIFNLAQTVGANYEAVKKALETSPWGTKNHLQIVYKGKRGVNGHCLPKDIEALATLSRSFFFRVVSEKGQSYELF